MFTLLCVPTFNPGEFAPAFVEALRRQTITPDQLVIVDSGSSDASPDYFRTHGFSVLSIPQSEFNHGKTRQLCIEAYPAADIVFFLTQDAILGDCHALQTLLDCFADKAVGAAYGRQLPRNDAGAIETHARLFNYPNTSKQKSLADVPTLGIKTAFFSNSFAAYRRSALIEAGGFPSRVILGEDTWVAAKMLRAGWRIAYCAEATVVHSHSYGYAEEFRRYFDIGVFHTREAWLRREFGQPTGEGLRYILSEWRFLAKMAPSLFPSAILRTVLKFIGYKLGALERFLPLWAKRRLSLHTGYWSDAET